MKTKRLIDSRLRRTVPNSFGWVDHRLVREGQIKKCNKDALALYLFLITVSDADGLSYYSDEKTSFLLSMCRQELETARKELLKAGWILWNGWLYQLLNLAPPIQRSQPTAPRKRTSTEARSFKHVLADIVREVSCD